MCVCVYDGGILQKKKYFSEHCMEQPQHWTFTKHPLILWERKKNIWQRIHCVLYGAYFIYINSVQFFFFLGPTFFFVVVYMCVYVAVRLFDSNKFSSVIFNDKMNDRTNLSKEESSSTTSSIDFLLPFVFFFCSSLTL